MTDDEKTLGAVTAALTGRVFPGLQLHSSHFGKMVVEHMLVSNPDPGLNVWRVSTDVGPAEFWEQTLIRVIRRQPLDI